MNKRVIFSFGLIAILLIYLIVVNYKKSSEIAQIKKWEGEAQEIIIGKGDVKTRIYQKDNKWVINDEGYPADSSIVSGMESKMKELKVIDFISKRGHYARYDLSEDKAITVTVSKENIVVRDILIGKKSSNSQTTYIKFSDKPDIYLASGALSKDFEKTVEELRDKEIYEVSKDSIESVELVYKGKKLTFTKIVEKEKVPEAKEAGKDKNKPEKPKERWICNEFKRAKIDKKKFDSFLIDVRSVKAESYSDIDKGSLKRPQCILTLKVFDKNVKLNIYNKDKEEKYLCASTESPYVFIMNKWSAKKFFKTLSDFSVK